MSLVKFVNTENLRIARENIGLTTLAASEQISTSKTDLVAAWEAGQSLPTWSQISKLAKVYNVSELLFFSNEPLQRNREIPDYRVGANHQNDEKVNKLINIVISRQKWLENEFKETNSDKNPLVGSGRHINDPAKLADLITEKLEIDLGEIKKIRGIGGRKKALNYLIGQAENKGIFVGKTISYIDLPVDDIRGLFVSNDYCPYIIINRKDAVSAQIFSFIHELSHLFRKTDAISNSLEFQATNRSGNSEEVFCNKVAAELLLPRKDFEKEVYTKSDIDQISETYKVSKLFIFFRLKELGLIRPEIQEELEKEIRIETEAALAQKRREEAQKKPGGNYTNSMKDSNGALFNKAISKSYLENKIGYVEASNLLRFSVEKT